MLQFVMIINISFGLVSQVPVHPYWKTFDNWNKPFYLEVFMDRGVRKGRDERTRRLPTHCMYYSNMGRPLGIIFQAGLLPPVGLQDSKGEFLLDRILAKRSPKCQPQEMRISKLGRYPW